VRRLLLLVGLVAVLAVFSATVSPASRDVAAAGPTAKEWREAGADVFELALRRKILHERLAATIDDSMSADAREKALQNAFLTAKRLKRSAESAEWHAESLRAKGRDGADSAELAAMLRFQGAARYTFEEAQTWIDLLVGIRGGATTKRIIEGWRHAVAVSSPTGRVLRDAWKKLQRQYLEACREAGKGKCTPLAAPPAAPAVPKTPPPVLKPITFEQELLSGSWTFGRVNGDVICTITFTKTVGKYGDYVLRACFPNESFWRLEGNTLTFLHSDGTPTSKLTRKNANYWEGPYLGHPTLPSKGTIHYIRR